MKWLILVRHAESTKNRSDSFASPSGVEELTDSGRADLEVLAPAVQSLITRLAKSTSRTSVKIFSGRSLRTRDTAERLARDLIATRIETPLLDSFVSPVTTGRSMASLIREEPGLARRILTYRAGLMNSYSVHPSFASDLRVFEGELREFVDGLIANDSEVVVLISSRSPITALLIQCARRTGDYPSDYFGYVELPAASTSVVSFADHSAPSLEMIGIPPSELEYSGAWMLS